MNHNKDFEFLQDDIYLIVSNGYKPIAVTQIYMEDTFVFETEEEAKRAYHQFEKSESGQRIGEIIGWWYGKEQFLETVKEYEEEYKEKVLIYWLNETD